MKNNERKYLFFNKKIVMIAATVMMMGQICFMPKIAQSTVEATRNVELKPIVMVKSSIKDVQDGISGIGKHESVMDKEIFDALSGLNLPDTSIKVGLDGLKYLLDENARTNNKLQQILSDIPEIRDMYGDNMLRKDGKFYTLSEMLDSLSSPYESMVEGKGGRTSRYKFGTEITENMAEIRNYADQYLRLKQAGSKNNKGRALYIRNKLLKSVVRLGKQISMVREILRYKGAGFVNQVLANVDENIGRMGALINGTTAIELAQLLRNTIGNLYRAMLFYTDEILQQVVEKFVNMVGYDGSGYVTVTDVESVSGLFLSMLGINRIELEQGFDAEIKNGSGDSSQRKHKGELFETNVSPLYEMLGFGGVNNAKSKELANYYNYYLKMGDAQIANQTPYVQFSQDEYYKDSVNQTLAIKRYNGRPGMQNAEYRYFTDLEDGDQKTAEYRRISDISNKISGFIFDYKNRLNKIYSLMDQGGQFRTNTRNSFINSDTITDEQKIRPLYNLPKVMEFLDREDVTGDSIEDWDMAAETYIQAVRNQINTIGFMSEFGFSKDNAGKINDDVRDYINKWDEMYEISGVAQEDYYSYDVPYAALTFLMRGNSIKNIQMDYASLNDKYEINKKLSKTYVNDGEYIGFIEEGEKTILAGTFWDDSLTEEEKREIVRDNERAIENYEMIKKAYLNGEEMYGNLLKYDPKTYIIGKITDKDKDKDKVKYYGVTIKRMTKKRLESFLNDIENMADDMGIYRFRNKKVYRDNFVLSTLFYLYEAVNELSSDSFVKETIKKEEFLDVIEERILSVIRNYDQEIVSEKEAKEILEKIRLNKEIEYKELVKICKVFTYLNKEEISNAAEGFTESIGLERFADVIKRILMSHDSKFLGKWNKITERMVKVVGKNGDYSESSDVANSMQKLFDMIKRIRGKKYNSAFNDLSMKITGGKSEERKKIFTDILQQEGKEIRIEYVQDIIDLPNTLRKFSNFFGSLEQHADNDKNKRYSYRVFELDNIYGPQGLMMMFFRRAKDVFNRLADDMEEYLKISEDKEENKYKKLRDSLCKHVEDSMDLLSKLTEMSKKESDAWENVYKLLGDDLNEELSAKFNEAMNYFIGGIGKSINGGDLEEVEYLLGMVGVDNRFGYYYGINNSPATSTMRDALENIRTIFNGIAQQKQNSEIERKGMSLIQEIATYEILDLIFSKNYFSKELTIMNIDFNDGKAIKDETDLNKDNNGIIDKEQNPYKNFQNMMYKYIDDLLSMGSLYKGLYSSTYRDGWRTSSNRIDSIKSQLRDFKEKSEEIFKKLDGFYAGEKLTDQDKEKEDKKDEIEDEENEDDLKEKKDKIKEKKEEEKEEEKKKTEVKSEIMKIKENTKGWNKVQPFKNDNLEKSEGNLRFRLNGDSIELELTDFNLPPVAAQYKVVIRIIVNDQVFDEVTVMNRVSENLYRGVVKLPVKPVGNVSVHGYIKFDGDKSPITQLEGKNFVFGIDLLNLVDVVEDALKSIRKTKGKFFKDDKTPLENPPTMEAFDLGEKYLIRTEGADLKGVVATICPNGPTQITDAERRIAFTETEAEPGVYYLMIPKKIVSQIGKEFTIHCHDKKQSEQTFKFFVRINFNEAEEINTKEEKGDENEEKDEEKKQEKKENLQVETDDEEDTEADSENETDDEEDEEKIKKGKKKSKKKKNKDESEKDEKEKLTENITKKLKELKDKNK